MLSQSIRDIGFASRVVQHGFAACCEDVAPPFRTIGPFLPGLCPFRISLEFLGVRGIAAKKRTTANGRAKPHPHNGQQSRFVDAA